MDVCVCKREGGKSNLLVVSGDIILQKLQWEHGEAEVGKSLFLKDSAFARLSKI